MKDESATRGGLRPLVLAPSKRLFGLGRAGGGVAQPTGRGVPSRGSIRPPDDLPDGAALGWHLPEGLFTPGAGRG